MPRPSPQEKKSLLGMKGIDWVFTFPFVDLTRLPNWHALPLHLHHTPLKLDGSLCLPSSCFVSALAKVQSVSNMSPGEWTGRDGTGSMLFKGPLFPCLGRVEPLILYNELQLGVCRGSSEADRLKSGTTALQHQMSGGQQKFACATASSMCRGSYVILHKLSHLPLGKPQCTRQQFGWCLNQPHTPHNRYDRWNFASLLDVVLWCLVD